METLDCKLFIDNDWHDSDLGEKIAVNSPWDGSHVGNLQAANSDQANHAITCAANAFKTWKQTTIAERVEILKKSIDLLRKSSDELGALLSREIGKTEESAKSEIDRSIEYMELSIEAIKHMKGSIYYGEVFPGYKKGQKTGLYNRVPIGVVLAISPFNYPINLSVTKVIPALLAGNTAVLKPSTQGAVTSIEFYKRLIEAGLPNGVFNIVTGKSSEIGDTLVKHPDIALIAFTGSTNTGNHIAKTIERPIPLLFELGGKDFGIVTDKADLEMAAKEIIGGAFSYCGQRCTAHKMTLVFDSVADELNELLLTQSKEIGKQPMINEESADYIDELVADAKDKGVKVLLEGEREHNKVSPFVLDNVTDEMRMFNEEQFGPILPIMRVKDEAEAIEKANSSAYGLQASVYTQDIDQAMRMADKLEVGTVQINGKPNRGPDNFPFGGIKGSGLYMQGLEETIELMTRGKLTVVNRH